MPTLGSSCAILGEFLLGGDCDTPTTPAPFVLLTGFTDDGELTHNAIGEMLQLNVTRGIDSDAGTTTVGTAQIVLKNHDGRYSPLRDDSPLYPDVEVGRAISAQLRDSDGNLQGQFAGSVTEINLDPAPSVRQATISCADYLETLRRVVISTPLYEGRRSDQLIASVLTLAGYTGDTDLEVGVKTFPFVSWRNVSALDAIQQVIDCEQGTFFISAGGVPTFHNRYHRVAITTPEAVFNNSFSAFSYRVSINDIFNEAIVTAHPRTISSAVKIIWSWDEIPYFLAPGESLNIVAEFSDGQGGNPCEGKNVITPVPQTDYYTSYSPNGQNTFPDNISITNFVVYGQYATMTITNEKAYGFYVARLQIRGYSVVQQNAITVIEADQDSINTYGFKSTITLDLPLESTLLGAQDTALYLMQVYGNPIPRIEFMAQPGDDARLDAIAQLDLNGVVEITQPDVGLEDELFFIDQIQLAMGATVAGITKTYSATAVPVLENIYIILDSPDQTFDDRLGA